MNKNCHNCVHNGTGHLACASCHAPDGRNHSTISLDARFGTDVPEPEKYDVEESIEDKIRLDVCRGVVEIFELTYEEFQMVGDFLKYNDGKQVQINEMAEKYNMSRFAIYRRLNKICENNPTIKLLMGR